MTRKKYTKEFKAEAVRLSERGEKSIAQVAADLADWLRQHPSVNTATRDRSGEYAQAITQVSPQTQQVADRWHLLHNLREAVQQTVLRHQHEIEQTWQATTQTKSEVISPFTHINRLGTAEVQISSQISREGRKARYEANTFPERRKNRATKAHLIHMCCIYNIALTKVVKMPCSYGEKFEPKALQEPTNLWPVGYG